MIGLQAIANQRTADDLPHHAGRHAADHERHGEPAQDDRRRSGEDDALAADPDRPAGHAPFATLPLESAVSNADTLTRNLSEMSIQLKSHRGAARHAARRRSTPGREPWASSPPIHGLYNDMRAVSQSLKTLIDELNKHPGKLTVQVKMF